MSETPISPLRARMIEDMSVRQFGEKTQNDYIRHVKTFSTFLDRSPVRATPEDLRRFQVHQSKEGVQPPTINSSVSALRFFFRVTLNRPEMCRHLTMVRQSQKLPTVLSKEEVLQLLEAAPGVKYKAAFSVAYGAGLRVSEVANLKVSDIDSKRMLIRVEQGKGKKDRHAMLSPQLLAILQDYWWVARPRLWLFPGRDPLLPITTRQLYRVVRDTAEASRSAYRPTYCAIHLRRICMSRVLISVQSKCYSEWRHTVHEQPAEARITYRYHPRFGEVVQIKRRLETGGLEFVVVLQPDGSFASLPAWMTEPAASRFEIGDEPHFPLHILRLMRAEVDALLGFLLSESKTGTADNGAQIRKSPTKPARRGDAAREAVPCSQGRARGPRGSSAPRDRSDAGQRKKRGEHP